MGVSTPILGADLLLWGVLGSRGEGGGIGVRGSIGVRGARGVPLPSTVLPGGCQTVDEWKQHQGSLMKKLQPFMLGSRITIDSFHSIKYCNILYEYYFNIPFTILH